MSCFEFYMYLFTSFVQARTTVSSAAMTEPEQNLREIGSEKAQVAAETELRQAEPEPMRVSAEQVIVKKEPEEEVQVKSEPVEEAMTQNLESVQCTLENKTVDCTEVKEKSTGEELTSVGDSVVAGESK